MKRIFCSSCLGCNQPCLFCDRTCPCLSPLNLTPCSRQFDDKGKALALALVKLVTVTTNLNVLSDVDKSYKGVLWNIIDDYRAKFIANFKGRKAKDIKLLNRDDWTPNLQIPNLSSLYSLPLQVKFLKDLDFSDTSVVCPFILVILSYLKLSSLKKDTMEEGKPLKEQTRSMNVMFSWLYVFLLLL